jgi:hypothetical protein
MVMKPRWVRRRQPEVETLSVRDEPDGEQDGIGFERLLAVPSPLTVTVAFAPFTADIFDAGLHQAGDAAASKEAEGAAGIGVFERDERIKELDDGDFGAIAGPEVAELHTDRAAADDDGALRNGLVLEGLAAGEDDFAVRLDAGEQPGGGAGGDDDGGSGVILAAAGDGARALEGGGTGDDGDAVVAQAPQRRRPYRQRAAAVDGGGEVEGGLCDPVDAPGLRVADQVDDVGVLEERLAGNATPVEAKAAEPFAFEEDHGLAELGRANGGDVAAGATADDCDIVVSHSLHLDYHRFD